MKWDRGSKVTLKKELKTALRDRRTLYSTVILPLVLPLLMFLPMMFGMSKSKKAQEEPTRVILLNSEILPGLRDSLLTYSNFTFLKAGNPEVSIREEKADVGVKIERIPNDSLSWKVIISYNPLRLKSKVGYEKVRSGILLYSSTLTQNRLKSLGVPKNFVKPIVIESNSVASPKEMGGEVAGLLIAMLVLIGAFSGGMATSIDATAGEKERKTLEVLFAAPVRRDSIVLGKFLAASLVSFTSVILTIFSVSILGTYVSGFIPTQEFSFSVSVSPEGLIIGILTLILTIAFIVSIEIAVGIFARTYREAQSYMTPLAFIFVLPIILIQFLLSKPSTSMMLVPLLNTIYVIKDVLKGSAVTQMGTTAIIANGVYCLIALRLAFRMFRNERAILR